MTMEIRSLLAISNFRINSAENEDALNIKFMAVDYLRNLESGDEKEKTFTALQDIANYNISDLENIDAWVMKAYAVNTITQNHAETDDEELPTRISTVTGKPVLLEEEDKDIYARVEKVLVEHLGVEPDTINITSHIIDDLGADSLDTVELVMAFEEEFDREIPDEIASQLETVNDIIVLVKKGMIHDKCEVVKGAEVDLDRLRTRVKVNSDVKKTVLATIKAVTGRPIKRITMPLLVSVVTENSKYQKVRLMDELQENFGTEIPDDFTDKVETVKDIVLYMSDARPFYKLT